MLLQANEIRGCYAILPTPYTPIPISEYRGQASIDLDEAARCVDQLIKDGSAAIMAIGTTGEGATINWNEFKAFTQTVVDAAAKRVPVLVGGTRMGTHETVDWLRYAQDVGADGSLLGIPMWQPCTEDIAVNFYKDISEALPDFMIQAYANPHAFRFDFPASFWGKVAKVAPTVTSVKFMNPRIYKDCVKAVEGKINFLPFPEVIRDYTDQEPDAVTAVWATSASMGPRPIIKLLEAWEKRDLELYGQIADDIKWAGAPIMKPDGIIPSGEFPYYNIQFEKLRFEATGYVKCGPGRPPYDIMPEHFAADALENARRWLEVVEKYKD